VIICAEGGSRNDRSEYCGGFCDGWTLKDSGLIYHRQLLIGHDPAQSTSHLSICAWDSVWDSKEPVFDRYDHERNSTVWVQGVPTPQRAAHFLAKHGGSSLRAAWASHPREEVMAV
jgi:hypothetical protein